MNCLAFRGRVQNAFPLLFVAHAVVAILFHLGDDFVVPLKFPKALGGGKKTKRAAGAKKPAKKSSSKKAPSRTSSRNKSTRRGLETRRDARVERRFRDSA